jgi:hypothetical protein
MTSGSTSMYSCLDTFHLSDARSASMELRALRLPNRAAKPSLSRPRTEPGLNLQLHSRTAR